MKLEVKILENEYFFGGSTQYTAKLPISCDTEGYFLDMNYGHNQTMPLYVSTEGRVIWCEEPMTVSASGGVITCEANAEIFLEKYGDTLRDAYLGASKAHFPFSGKVPPLKFFESAQYNTWMEMDYNQTQEGVLKYAHAIVDNGYTPGILMIDEGWHTRYGLWEFDETKFPDPKGMIDELHSLGFTVMLWVVPMYTADGLGFITSAFKDRTHLSGGVGNKELFLRNDEGKVALVEWWNGYSAMLNLCKKEDCDFLEAKLRRLMDEYGVDGFKLDGGNICAYNPQNIANGPQTKYSPAELNIAWNDFGSRFEYHEYKDTFKGGGKPVIQRISDRNHKWGADEVGLASVLPAALCQGLIGHPFICPDMIGGGEWSFNYLKDFKVDEELFVRMAQCSALFPMMQFSWAPWRMLGKEAQKYCLDAARLHAKFADYIVENVKASAVSGDPILRSLEYQYPHKGYAKITDEFLLGDRVLVAPVITKGQTEREVVLPEGEWLYLEKTPYSGGCTVTVPAPIDTLPYFIRK